jgi:hypothetical protein
MSWNRLAALLTFTNLSGCNEGLVIGDNKTYFRILRGLDEVIMSW